MIIYVGGLMAIEQDISVGEWYLFVQGLTIFFLPDHQFGVVLEPVPAGIGRQRGVFALIDDEPLVVQTANEPVGLLRGEIVLIR